MTTPALHTGADIDAREAQILGPPQRIAPLAPEDLDEEARALVISIRASVGANPHEGIPPVFATMLKHPGLYRCTMDIGIQLLGKGELSPRERELAVLRVAWLCRAPYEWGQHVEIAKRYAISAEEIERVTQGSTAPGWTDHEAAIVRGVEELLADQMIADATWNVLATTWTERQLMEFPTLVGQYVSVAYSQNALRIRLNAGNRGLRHR
ncbi:MAG: carboxymuconolactone decarboxylase family protein [Steroidobacteraceae bacterium]